jgi:hypothetical protein
MEHTEAAGTMAAERYLLDEMEAAERDAFEEHFFNCAECAADVRDEALIAGAIRSEGHGRATKIVPFRQKVALRASWLATAAAVSGMAFMGYQNALRSAPPLALMSDARVIPNQQIVWPTRGDQSAQVVELHGQSKVLFVDVRKNEESARYRISLRSGSKQMRLADRARDQIDELVLVYLPGTLAPGKYELAVDGIASDGTESPIDRADILIR